MTDTCLKISIWEAEQTEPGLRGKRFCATKGDTQPAPISPTRHPSGLLDEDSLYTTWRKVRTIDAIGIFKNALGETIIEVRKKTGETIPYAPDELI